MDWPAIGGLSLLRCEFADGEELACSEGLAGQGYLLFGFGTITADVGFARLSFARNRSGRRNELELFQRKGETRIRLDALFRRSDVVCNH